AASLADMLAEVNLPDQNWRLGNYEILEEIGRGGMGVIYRARQRHSRRIVALKRVLSYHSDSRETLARFRREAQAAASLDHPNILPIYEVSESEDGLPFFSMKFAPGGTLQQVAPALRNEPRQCVALVAKIARAVQYAVSRQAAESPAPKLRTLSKLADRDLETICSRCLERDPKLRYPSAHDLAEDLERWLEGRPIIARPVALPVRIWRWSKRNPTLAATLASCAVLAGLAVGWQVRSRNLEREATQ